MLTKVGSQSVESVLSETETRVLEIIDNRILLVTINNRGPPVQDNKLKLIFFVQRADTREIYIGASNDPPTRCYRLQNDHPETIVELIGTTSGTLPEIRAQWHHLHTNNSWYAGAMELLDYIKNQSMTMADPGPDPEELKRWIDELIDDTSPLLSKKEK